MSAQAHNLRRRSIFAFKRSLLQLRRLGQDATSGPKRYDPRPIDRNLPIAAESKTGFWTDASIAERRLQLGKVQNLRITVKRLNGIVVPAGETFGFWRQIGRATRGRGFAVGRELREGCIIPTIGGGLCQLSNALYDLALKTDCDIVERHAHTRVVPGSAAEEGRDAAVAWNYIDLRFRPKSDLQIEALLTRGELILRFRTKVEATVQSKPTLRVIQATGSCVTCGREACDRHSPELLWDGSIRRAYVLDAVSPEWLDLIEEDRDDLLIPIDGSRFRMDRYAWPTKGRTVKAATVASLHRMFVARRVAGSSPPVVRRSQLEQDYRVAIALSKLIDPEIEHLIVSQSLLPGLFLENALAGRNYSVLLQRLPMSELQRRLDLALTANPDQRLLGDFRADADLVEAETAALAGAMEIVTPHPGFAKLFSNARIVPWKFSSPSIERKPEPIVAFPGPTAARKGAYALREAVRQLNVPIMLLGKNLEDPEFWQGCDVRVAEDWLARAAVVVQPSIVEERPIPLLRAHAAGIPIVAGELCGLPEGDFRRVEFGDAAGIADAIASVLAINVR